MNITFPDPEPEPEVVDIIREHDRKVVGFIENVLHILNAYQHHQTSERAMLNPAVKRLRMSTRAMALALGYPLAAGLEPADEAKKRPHPGPAELAKKCGMSKATVTKCLNHFIRQLRLGKLPGQRDESARKNMADARRRQVTPKRDNKLETLAIRHKWLKRKTRQQSK